MQRHGGRMKGPKAEGAKDFWGTVKRLVGFMGPWNGLLY